MLLYNQFLSRGVVSQWASQIIIQKWPYLSLKCNKNVFTMMLTFDTILELIHRALVNSLISDHLLDLHILHMLQIRRYTIKDFFFIHEEFQSSLIA